MAAATATTTTTAKRTTRSTKRAQRTQLAVRGLCHCACRLNERSGRKRGSWGRMTDSSTERDPAKAANRMYFLHSLQVYCIYLCFIIFFSSNFVSLSPALFAIRVIPLTTNASYEFILILLYNNPILSLLFQHAVCALFIVWHCYDSIAHTLTLLLLLALSYVCVLPSPLPLPCSRHPLAARSASLLFLRSLFWSSS